MPPPRPTSDDLLETTHLLYSPDGAPRALEVLRAYLTVLSGPVKENPVPLERKVFRVGCAPGNDLILEDPTVSHFHLTISAEREGFLVRDLGSTNGVRVNGVRVREAFLDTGCLLSVGQTRLRFDTRTDCYEIPLSEKTVVAGMIGCSPAMRAVFGVLQHYASVPHNVLLEGESGTGKEHAARALHLLGDRKDGPFEVVDCTSLPRDLIEAELFGCIRGAFTGATESREGAFARADCGTLFLDEIGELPLDLQPNLLRVVQERTFRPLGSSKIRRSDFRLVVATNRDLGLEVNEGRFREDLFFRLAELRVTLPALRERREDIPLLIEHFVYQEFDRIRGWSVKDFPRIPQRVMKELVRHEWPGNVRQLRNYVAKLVIDSGLRPLTEEDFLAETRLNAPSPESIPDSTFLIDGALSKMIPGTSNLYQVAKKQLLDAFEMQFLQHFLDRAGQNVTKAAELAGMYRQEFHRLLRRHNLPRRQDRDISPPGAVDGS